MKSHEWQLSNLKLSKKLKELGVKQESYFWWFKKAQWNVFIIKDFYEMESIPVNASVESYSAFTVAELGEMLPASFKKEIGHGYFPAHYYLESHKSAKTNKHTVSYVASGNDHPIQKHNLYKYADTEANARASMLIHLIENKLIDVPLNLSD